MIGVDPAHADAVAADARDFRDRRDARLARAVPMADSLPLPVLAAMLYAYAASKRGLPSTHAMFIQAADVISALADAEAATGETAS